jgi:hypothetical protein
MTWRIMDTYNLVKDIEGPFPSSVVYEKMLNLGMAPMAIRARYCAHLRKLAKQGYLTRTGAKKGQNGNAVYIYEVVKNE